MSISVAFDGTNYLVGMQGDAVDRHNVSAQMISPSGTLTGALISTGSTGGAPQADFDGTNYLLVWTANATTPQNQVYGRFIAPSGSVVGTPFRIGPASGGHEVSAIAFDGTNYLVLWYCRSDATCTGVYGQIVTPSGSLLGPVVALSNTARKGPAVAFGGTNYLAVWTASDSATVVGRFVSRTGAVAGPELVINASPAPSDNPESVAFDGTNYLVLWNDEVGGMGSHQWDIFGQLVTSAGALAGAVIPITTAPGAQVFPFVAFDGTNYLVTWTDLRNDTNNDVVCDAGEGTCADVYGQYLGQSGTLVGSAFPIVTDAENQIGSPVTFGAEKYLVAWNSGSNVIPETRGDIFGRFIVPPNLACVGDCGTDRVVTVDELLSMVNIALGNADVSACMAGDTNKDGEITVDEILTAVNNALNGCRG